MTTKKIDIRDQKPSLDRSVNHRRNIALIERLEKSVDDGDIEAEEDRKKFTPDSQIDYRESREHKISKSYQKVISKILKKYQLPWKDAKEKSLCIVESESFPVLINQYLKYKFSFVVFLGCPLDRLRQCFMFYVPNMGTVEVDYIGLTDLRLMMIDSEKLKIKDPFKFCDDVMNKYQGFNL